MDLQSIEKIVCAQIGEIYSDISTDTNRTADFANLHTCVNLARDEIKLNTVIPSILKWSSVITVVNGTKKYSLPTDFDLPHKVFYTSSESEYELDQVYPSNLLQKVNDTTAKGTPAYYMILDNVSNVIQIELYDTPDEAGSFKCIYKPLLTALSVITDEDILMKKYYNTVIKLATAFAWQIIKKDNTQFDKFMMFGRADFSLINFRETQADSSFKEIPDSLIRRRRMARPTQ